MVLKVLEISYLFFIRDYIPSLIFIFTIFSQSLFIFGFFIPFFFLFPFGWWIKGYELQHVIFFFSFQYTAIWSFEKLLWLWRRKDNGKYKTLGEWEDLFHFLLILFYQCPFFFLFFFSSSIPYFFLYNIAEMC